MATKKAVKKPARQTGGKAVKSAKPVTKAPSKQASKTTKKPLHVKAAKPSPKKVPVKKMASRQQWNKRESNHSGHLQ